MKSVRIVIVFLALFASGSLLAQDNVVGTWQGKLAISAEVELTVQFIIADAGAGNYTAMINSPDNQSITNVPASLISIDGGNVSLEFDVLSGAYEGQLTDGNLTGEWSQLSDTFPLVLSPYVVEALSLEVKQQLQGQWSAAIDGGNANVVTNAVFTFELNGEELTGSLGLPAQGVSGISLAEFAMADGIFSFRIPQAQVRYEGVISGEEIEGTWHQGGMDIPVNMTKGVETSSTVFNLTEADKETLLGHWVGSLGPVTIVLRFERDEAGEFISLMDSPVQNAKDLPVTEVSMVDGQLKVVLALGAEFNGTINGEDLVGTWTQGGMTNPVTLSKGEYTPPVAQYNLTPAQQEVLMGTWSGQLGPLTIVLRFEQDANGEFISFVDSPTQGATGLGVTEVSQEGDQLKVVLAIGAEFRGAINGEKIEGAWIQGGMNNPLTVTKD